jgi:hypothetical protein
VLGGDVHAGALHLITSEKSGTDHDRNRHIIQLTSSPISHEPQLRPFVTLMADHFVEGKDLGEYASEVFLEEEGLLDPEREVTTRFHIDRALRVDTGLPGPTGAPVIATEPYTPIYRANLTGIVHERNYGYLDIRRVGDASARTYGIRIGIEGDTKFLRHDLLVDLNAATIRPMPDPTGDYPTITIADVNGVLDRLRRRG